MNLLQIIPIGYSTVIQKSQNKNSNKRPFASRSSAKPLKNSEIKLSSEVYESISECRSLVAYSINSALGGEYSFFRINGDFSSDKETLREKLSQKLGLIVQSEIRHNRYFIQFIPDPKLHSRFKNRLLDIAAFLERGNVTMETIELFNNGLIGHTLGDSLTNENFKSLKEGMNAFYLADLVIRDFGTHCVNSIHAGGVLAKIDTLDTSTLNIKKEDRWHLGASASTSFANLFKVKLAGSVKNNDTLVESYESKVTYSQILTYGGPIIYMSNVNLSLWESSLDNQLVAIDRSGQPIYELITDRSLPELPGCMNPLSMFYDNEANVASTECDLHGRQITNSTLYLGGVYQKCTGPEDLCLSETIANPLTGDLTCSQGFTPVQLLPQQIRRCYSVCNEKSWFKSRDCTTNCAITESYWCSRDPSLSSSPKVLDIDENGYLFGGLYTDKEVNSLTKQYNCPQYYWPIALGRRMRICLSSDRELGGKQNDYSQLFSALWPKKCPPGYTAHLAAMEDICQVNYCVEANLLKEQTRRQLKRPPFVMPFSFDSHLFKLGGSNNFIGSSSDVIHDTNGNMIRKINGRWEEPDQLKTDNNLYAKSQNIHYAFIATLCTLLPVIIILILVISILAFYYIRQQNRFISRRN
ncbi:Macrophage-expressed gene 1 protein [Schistosoma japonicum]|nr:Macrophage-expressed gene 1 protein [Schistosoma japonicum]